jgi:methylthioribose-1-phosphate isomerase
VLDIRFKNKPATPKDASARNPAFDVTPHELLNALVTEKGVVYPPFDVNLPKIMQES